MMLYTYRRDSLWRRLRHATAKAVGRFGGGRVAESLTWSVPRILMFHRFSRYPGWRTTSLETLRDTLDAVGRAYRVVSLDAAVESVLAGQPLGPRTLVLTVDDGYEDFYRLALPEFERYGLPVTLYVPTDFIDGKCWLWPDRLLWMIRETQRDEVKFESSGPVSLSTLRQRRQIWNALADQLLEVDEATRSDRLRELEEVFEVRVPEHPTRDYRAMTWEQIRDAARRGVCIASQAGAHIPLARESIDIQRHEAKRSKRRLEMELGASVRHFSYPHGRARDFTVHTMQAARDAGYVSAAAAVPSVGRSIEAFALPRISIPEFGDDLPNSLSGMSHLAAWSRS